MKRVLVAAAVAVISLTLSQAQAKAQCRTTFTPNPVSLSQPYHVHIGGLKNNQRGISAGNIVAQYPDGSYQNGFAMVIVNQTATQTGTLDADFASTSAPAGSFGQPGSYTWRVFDPHGNALCDELYQVVP